MRENMTWYKQEELTQYLLLIILEIFVLEKAMHNFEVMTVIQEQLVFGGIVVLTLGGFLITTYKTRRYFKLIKGGAKVKQVQLTKVRVKHMRDIDYIMLKGQVLDNGQSIIWKEKRLNFGDEQQGKQSLAWKLEQLPKVNALIDIENTEKYYIILDNIAPNFYERNQKLIANINIALGILVVIEFVFV